ncbi:MAG: tail fiber domain-containing protein [Candidatus Omnitrophota bacterium]
MRRLKLVQFWFALFISLFYCFAFAEDITLTTYYPAPYGVYNEVRSLRLAIGTNYYDSGEYCWSGACTNIIDSDDILLVEGNVGINTWNPDVALDIVGNLDVIGNINYTGTLTDVSDRRLKENIVVIGNPISKLEAINGVYFNMIGSDKRELGLIAQNVQETLPEAVTVVDDQEGYLGVDYTSIIPVLIEAIKQQQEKISALEQAVDKLKQKL